ESEDTTAGIRERLSAMEDLLDDLPEGSVGKLRAEIDSIRALL
ncbi:hypothetical protein EV691_14628, partial [Azotobacter chroococcum]